jgi:hypothetical protein
VKPTGGAASAVSPPDKAPGVVEAARRMKVGRNEL